MFERHIGFLDELACTVKVFTKSGMFVGEGKLVLSENSSPQVSFELSANIKKFSKNTYFRCETDNSIFTLLECEVLNNSIFPKLVINGEKLNTQFKKISVLLQGLSEWMDTTGQFEITEQEVIRKREQKTFSVDILEGSKSFSLSCEHWCETKHQSSNSHMVNMYTLLTYEVKKGGWSSSELISKVQDLCTIFSLLLGYPINVEYILDKSQRDKNYSLYYLNSTTANNYVSRSSDCFVSSDYLYKKDKWKDLLQRYFDENVAVYKSVWSRVANILAYDGFWEYRILAYVSLVDRYVSIFSKEYDEKIPHKKFKKSLNELKLVLEGLKEKADVQNQREKYLAVYDSMRTQFQSINNSKFASFSDKFDLKIEKTNDDIIQIINLLPSEFEHLKKLRNAIAHGGIPPIKNGDNITYEVTISSKLALLLRYWIFFDLGFSQEDYIVFLNNWMHRTTRQARLNYSALDEASGRWFYLNTNKTNFLKAKNHQFGCIVLDYIKKSDSYRININATKSTHDWYMSMDKKYKSVEEMLMSIVDTNKVKNIAYVSNSYLKYRDEVFKINTGTCILNCPAYITSNEMVFDRLRVFDEYQECWLPSEFEKRVTQKYT